MKPLNRKMRKGLQRVFTFSAILSIFVQTLGPGLLLGYSYSANRKAYAEEVATETQAENQTQDSSKDNEVDLDENKAEDSDKKDSEEKKVEDVKEDESKEDKDESEPQEQEVEVTPSEEEVKVEDDPTATEEEAAPTEDDLNKDSNPELIPPVSEPPIVDEVSGDSDTDTPGEVLGTETVPASDPEAPVSEDKAADKGPAPLPPVPSDPIPDAKGNIDQCENGTLASPSTCSGSHWINGNLNSTNSHYREGDSVPFRIRFEDVSTSGSHTVVLEWNTLKSGKHAYDYLTTYNRTESGGNDPCSGVSGCGSPTTFNIPTDPTAVNQISGVFTMYNGTITGVSGYSTSGGSRTITLTFTATSATPVLAWGGHLATQFDWGVGNGSSSIGGSPIHMSLGDVDGKGGHQDRSIQGDAIFNTPGLETSVSSSSIELGQSVTDTATLSGDDGDVTGTIDFFVCGPSDSNPDCTTGGTQVGSSVAISNNSATSSAFTPSDLGHYCFRAEYDPASSAHYSPAFHTNLTTECFVVVAVQTGRGSLTLDKVTDPSGDQTLFDFTTSNLPTPVNPSLADATTPVTWSGLTTGTYVITETVVAGWTLSSAVCLGGQQSVVTPVTDGVSVALVDGENVTCTFTNTKNTEPVTTLEVKKILDPKRDLGLFDLQIDEATQAAGVSDGGTTNPVPVSAGRHTVGELGNGTTNLLDYTAVIGGDCNSDGTITLALGDQKLCTITNTRKASPGTGSLLVNKYADSDGNGTYETLNPSTFKWGLDNETPARDMGAPSATVVSGSHAVTESEVAGYHFVGWYYTSNLNPVAPCVGEINSGPINIVVTEGQSTDITLCNARDTGTITVIKQTNPSGVQDLFTFNLTGESTGSAQLMDGQSHDFTPLPTGNYAVGEQELAGWTQTSADCIKGGVDGPSYDPSRLVLGQGEHITCTFLNTKDQEGSPKLTITKTNNKLGVDQKPGDEVLYTLVVTAHDANVNNVEVVDLPPDGFSYEGGSWTAMSSDPLRGDLKASGVTPEPTYHSPGVWQLGNMSPDEVVTLTYKTKISTSQQAGLYPDLAWTDGTSGDLGSVIGNIDTGVFVGTQVNVVRDLALSKSYEPDEKIKIENREEVLGASTSLPSTGADGMWILIASTVLGLGVILAILGFAMKKKLNLTKSVKAFVYILALGIALSVTSSKSLALVPQLSIRVETPKTLVNTHDFNVSFVTLDIQSRAITVKCFKKGPSEAIYTQFGSDINLAAGGNSGNCVVNSSVVSAQGGYSFYATALAGSDSATSPAVNVTYDKDDPETPHNYKKESILSCQYKISFKTGDGTDYVEVYRSDEIEFKADSGSRIKTITIGSNTEYEFSDTKPNCGKTYYYALRAFDNAGNASGLTGDDITKVKVETTTTTKDNGTTVTGGGSTGAIPVSGITLPGTEGSTSGSVLGESSESGQNQNGSTLGSESQASKAAGKWFSWWWVLLALILLGVGAYVYNRNRR